MYDQPNFDTFCDKANMKSDDSINIKSALQKDYFNRYITMGLTTIKEDYSNEESNSLGSNDYISKIWMKTTKQINSPLITKAQNYTSENSMTIKLEKDIHIFSLLSDYNKPSKEQSNSYVTFPTNSKDTGPEDLYQILDDQISTKEKISRREPRSPDESPPKIGNELFDVCLQDNKSTKCNCVIV